MIDGRRRIPQMPSLSEVVMHTYIDPNLRRKPGKRPSRRPPTLKTPGQLLLDHFDEANDAARVPKSDQLPQGPKT